VRGAPPSPARAAVTVLPHLPGVYRFRDERNVVMYLGRATDLRSRVGSYWTGLGDRPRLRRMVERIAAVEAVPCDSVHEAAWLERNLLDRALPRFNRARGGQEVPGYLCLDLRPRSLGVTPTRRADVAVGTTTFGPYLGSTQLRLAVSALDRLHPLRYATGALTGSERDMAAVRGVDATDRTAMVEHLIAILERRPEAVRAALDELTRLRHEAVARLAFESAAQLQAEIEALDWLTAAQRVTAGTPLDVELFGWAAGVLTTFRIRAGRLDTWTRTPCSESSGANRSARTPQEWRAFVDRAVALDAQLARHSTIAARPHPPRGG
jgi:excinuclease ABC subunit C